MGSFPRATFVARACADDASSADRAHRVPRFSKRGRARNRRDGFDVSSIYALSGHAIKNRWDSARAFTSWSLFSQEARAEGKASG